MPECAYCRTETELHDGPTPVCVKCADESPGRRGARARLFLDLIEATKRAETATEHFALISEDIPSRMPHPDGVQRIQNASRELGFARDEMMKAHKRLNDFLNTGFVPDDLKISG